MIYLLKPRSFSSSSHYELPQRVFNFFWSVPQTTYMEGHGLTARQPTPAEDGTRTSPPLVASLCSINVLVARYLSSFHRSEEIPFFL